MSEFIGMNPDPVVKPRLRSVFDWIKRCRTPVLFTGALGFGAVAVFGARNYIGEQIAIERDRLVPKHTMVELVVAKHDLQAGERIGPDNMAIRELPAPYAPGGAILPDRFDAIAGSRLALPMRSGEPLLNSMLGDASSSGFASRLRPGVRAMTVSVDEISSLSGMLQPGDRIDLVLSVRPQPVAGVTAAEVTRLLMQDITVLATGRQVKPSAEEAAVTRAFTAITVEVDPQQAQKLVVAQRSGRLTALLRNPGDRQPLADPRLDVNTLLGLPSSPPKQARAVAPIETELIVGGRGTVLRDGPATAAITATPSMPATVTEAEPTVGRTQPAAVVPSAAFAARSPRPIEFPVETIR